MFSRHMTAGPAYAGPLRLKLDYTSFNQCFFMCGCTEGSIFEFRRIVPCLTNLVFFIIHPMSVPTIIHLIRFFFMQPTHELKVSLPTPGKFMQQFFCTFKMNAIISKILNHPQMSLNSIRMTGSFRAIKTESVHSAIMHLRTENRSHNKIYEKLNLTA